jgi:hypothetical protein
MYNRSRRLLAAALTFSAFFAAPAYADTTVGVPSLGGNCFPFGCGYTGEYQQIYGSSAFSGPITIDTVQFFPSASWPLNDNQGSFTLSFYLTSAAVDGLSTNPLANETTLLSSFGTFVPGTSYSFTGNAFTYDPSLGNLLLDITTPGAPSGSNVLYFSSTRGDPMSNLYRSGGTGALTTGTNGLVTTFSQTPAVPEPGTWVMMLIGFAAVGFSMRRRGAAARALQQIA